MINIPKTLFDSIDSQITEMKKYGRSNPDLMKTIFFAIILGDLIEWACHLGKEKDEKELREMLKQLLLTNCAFNVSFILNFDIFSSVNNPGWTMWWQEIYDKKETDSFYPDNEEEPSEEDDDMTEEQCDKIVEKVLEKIPTKIDVAYTRENGDERVILNLKDIGNNIIDLVDLKDIEI